MTTPGAAPSFAYRPALELVQRAQRKALEALANPLKDEGAIQQWKADVVQAAAGRLSDGMRALLADPELSALMQRWLLPAPRRTNAMDEIPAETEDEYKRRLEAADEGRLQLRELLNIEFAHALEDFSNSPAGEHVPGRGVTRPSVRATYVDAPTEIEP